MRWHWVSKLVCSSLAPVSVEKEEDAPVEKQHMRPGRVR
jgi:hypothetical protein